MGRSWIGVLEGEVTITLANGQTETYRQAMT